MGLRSPTVQSAVESGRPSADTPPKTPLKANLLTVDRFTTWNFIYTTAIANDNSRTGGQSYKVTMYRVIAIKPTPR